MFHKLINRIATAIPDHLAGLSHKTAIARGDRLAAAKEDWPEARFPTLYRDIPEDIRRPVIWDGRILGGRDVSHLMWKHLTPEVVIEAARETGYKAVRFAFFAALFMFVLWTQQYLLPDVNLGLLTQLSTSGAPVYVTAGILALFAASAIVIGLALAWGVKIATGWTGTAIRTRCIVASFIGLYVLMSIGIVSVTAAMEQMRPQQAQMFTGFGSTAPAPAVEATSSLPYPAWAEEIGAWSPVIKYYALTGILTASKIVGLIAATLLVFLLSIPAAWSFGFARTMKDWAASAGAPYTAPTRDALLVYKSRADGSRDAEYRAYCRQIDDATVWLKDSPIIPLGRATGTLRARGDMKAPVKGQIMGYDSDSIRTHTMTFGDTGSGKTRDVLRPMFRRIMSSSWGADHRMGAYVTDGKGTLWKDMEKIAVELGREVKIIGTGPGHYGVDLLKGMSPLEVSTTFKAVASQITGKTDYWTEQASILLMHLATIAKVVSEFDGAGFDFGERIEPYSLGGIMALAANMQLQKDIIGWMTNLKADPEHEAFHKAKVAPIDHNMDWIALHFHNLANDTRSSVEANLDSVLGKMMSAGSITDRFVLGSYEDMIDVDYALDGNILMVAVGETEFGLAGRVVSTWLKQRLFVLAKRRLITKSESCKNVSVALFADEFQMLVTTGEDSDEQFWNVARETGVFLYAATQSLAALKQAIGPEKTANLMNLMRNKIVLSTGEVETIDFIRKLVGDLPTGWEADENFYATQTMREDILPTDRAEPVAARLSLIPRWLSLDTPAMGSAVDLDERFSTAKMSAESSNSAQQAAYWRQEDKSREAIVSGIQWSSKLRHDELRQGQGFAFAMTYRAGVDRADIIDLRGL